MERGHDLSLVPIEARFSNFLWTHIKASYVCAISQRIAACGGCAKPSSCNIPTCTCFGSYRCWRRILWSVAAALLGRKVPSGSEVSFPEVQGCALYFSKATADEVMMICRTESRWFGWEIPGQVRTEPRRSPARAKCRISLRRCWLLSFTWTRTYRVSDWRRSRNQSLNTWLVRGRTAETLSGENHFTTTILCIDWQMSLHVNSRDKSDR